MVRRDGLIALDSRLCRVDAWALEAKLAEADAALLATPGVEGLHAVGEALALYRGRFLPADEHPTSIRLREALHARLVRVTAEAGRRHEAAGRWEDAVACYERALELEPGAEDLYRRLMRGYARLGRRAEALTLYARCRETLAALVGVLPSPETEALGRTLGAAQA